MEKADVDIIETELEEDVVNKIEGVRVFADSSMRMSISHSKLKTADLILRFPPP
jgi:hypothetical protein